MQSRSYTATTSTNRIQFPWKPNVSSSKPISWNLNYSLSKTLILNASLRTSVNYEHGEGLDKSSTTRPLLPIRLPVVVRQSGRISRYVWDGNSLELVGIDDVSLAFSLGLEDGLHRLVRLCNLFVKNLFIPKEVPENYMVYVKWKLLHRVFSSSLQVLATQAMFRAIGIGYSKSLPSAAAFNWVLKDGLGRLSRCIYTASQASSFDSNLKRVRFSSSVLFSLSIGIELLTPVFPQYFLLLASLANIAKQISLACYLATGPATHQSFAIGNNLGEVSAKAQIQSVCFDNLGLLLAALLNMSLKSKPRLLAGLPYFVYPVFSAIDLFGIYQGLKHVHLQTLTKDRLEIILNSWINSGHVPSPAEVSKEEGISFLWSKNKELWPIRIGQLDSDGPLPRLSLMVMQSVTGSDNYFICLEICRGWRRTHKRGIVLCLREDAGTSSVITGLLQACYVRKALLSSQCWATSIEQNDDSETVLQEWFKLIENGKRSAEKDLAAVDAQMSILGWATKKILLSAEEQTRYSFVKD